MKRKDGMVKMMLNEGKKKKEREELKGMKRRKYYEIRGKESDGK